MREQQLYPGSVEMGPFNVRLWDHVGTGLIVLAKTGVSYTNQVGGHTCEQPVAEGFFVPFGNDATLDDVLISAENGLTKLFDSGWRPIDHIKADNLDAFFRKYGEEHWLPWIGVSVDRERLDDCCEAWIHVVLDGPPDRFPFQGVALPTRAILTWCNSD